MRGRDTWLICNKHAFQRWQGRLRGQWEGQWLIHMLWVQREEGRLRSWASVNVTVNSTPFNSDSQTLMWTEITRGFCLNALNSAINSALAKRRKAQDSALPQAPMKCSCSEPSATLWEEGLQNLEYHVFCVVCVFTNMKQSQKALVFR